MARGFGTTLGSATTDMITASLATAANQRSYFIWSYRNGDGGTSAGRMWDQQINIAGTGPIVLNNGGLSAYQFSQTFDGTGGSWTWARPTTGVWSSTGVAYDKSATTNDPTVFQDSTKNTIGSGLTETSTPVGTATDGSNFYIGNRVNGGSNRVWDGLLAEFAVWNAILTDDEFYALAKGYSPALVRPNALVEYIPMVRSNVSYKLAAPTITGTAVQPHPRIIRPHSPQKSIRKFVTGGASGGGAKLIGGRLILT